MDEELTAAPNEPPSGDSAPELSVPPSYRPRKSAEVLELDMGDGLILYNHDGDLVHHLNPSAGIIWQLCDGEVTVEELGREIAEEYGLDPETLQRQVATVIAEFDTLGLVENARAIELRERRSRS
jgi:Coenzyme PQQ synthesis protein D (PqqD)